MESGSKNKYSFNRESSKKKIQKILELLSKESMNANQMMEAVFLSKAHIKDYIDYLKSQRLIYISKWVFEANGKRNMQVAYYRAGNRKSAPKPQPMTNNEVCKRYRMKIYSDQEKVDIKNAKRRAKRIQPKTDWASEWIKASNTIQVSQGGA